METQLPVRKHYQADKAMTVKLSAAQAGTGSLFIPASYEVILLRTQE